MSKQILVSLFYFFLVSCKGDFEERKLLDYSDKNGNYKLEIIEEDFNENDSLIFEKTRFFVLDSQNRIINENNYQFLFYNNQNKITEIKSVHRRGAKTNVLIYKYVYDEKQNLKMITYEFNKIDTFQVFKYNNFNQLIMKESPLRKFTVKYNYKDGKIKEITELDQGSVSKYSKFIYDKNGNKLIEDWMFNGNQKMRTYFKYNYNNKLISERDSSFTNSGNPNEYVEFLDNYLYDKNDSLIERRQFGRVLSEKEFKYRGKSTFKYKKIGS